jgi:flagellar biosynthesis regulator FlbT
MVAFSLPFLIGNPLENIGSSITAAAIGIPSNIVALPEENDQETKNSIEITPDEEQSNDIPSPQLPNTIEEEEETQNPNESNSEQIEKDKSQSPGNSISAIGEQLSITEVSDINLTTITLIYPTENINVTQHEFFNVTVNLTCASGYCGELNATLDPPATIYNFSVCSATGVSGPSEANCNTSYSGTDLEGLVTVSGGIQNWTVPSTGTYTISAQGASGVQGGSGSGAGAHGALMIGEFALTSGDVISVLVGQLGLRDGTYGGGGGGGTFVIDSTNDDILVIAGGGGGASIRSSTYTAGRDATTTIAGTNGSRDSVLDANAPGSNGAGGATSTNGGGAGAGYSGDGADSQSNSGGHSYLNGAAGGDSSSGNSDGGFGGGGAGYGGGGGGGGYNGAGAGGYDGSGGGGGGAGSVNNGTNQNNTIGTISQNGFVTIELANAAKGGTVSMSVNASPFYTNTTNPYNVTLNESESTIITWWVNATGGLNIDHTFFAYVNRTSDGLAYNNTTEINITIVDTTAPQINIQYPGNTTYSTALTELNYSYDDHNAAGFCWYSLNSGESNSSTLASATNFTTFSASNGGNDLILYCNDSSSNLAQANVSFTQDIPELSLTLDTPTGDSNATQNETFTVTVTVTCNNTNCGEVNLSLDPIPALDEALLPAAEEKIDGASVGVGIQSAISLLDNKSFTYDIQDGCDISDGQGDVFDGGLKAYINLSEYTGTRSSTQDDGREAVCDAQTKSNLNFSRQVYVPEDQNWARYLEILHNTQGYTVCVDVRNSQNMGSDGSDFMNTSDGNNTWDLSDNWMMWDDTSATAGDDAAGFIYQQIGSSEVVDVITPVTASGGANAFTWENVCVPAGETKILMHFFTQWDTRAQSEAEADVILNNYLDDIYIGNMTNAEKANVVNWDLASVKDGLISTTIGDTPFYTTDDNPQNVSLNAGESATISWSVNATGNIDSIHEFFAFVNMTSDQSVSNESIHWNVTIVGQDVAGNDTTLPYFSDIPSNQSINYQQTFAGIQFNGTDETAVNNYSIEANTNFTINDSGFLNNITKLSADTYIINVTVNDTSNNTNSTLWQITINQIAASLNLSINESQANLVNLTQNTTIPINATVINGDTTATINLYNNFTLINSNTTTISQISNNTNFTVLGYHNITFEYLASKNFTSTNISFAVNVTLPAGDYTPDTTPPSISYLLPTYVNNTNSTNTSVEINITIEEDIQLNSFIYNWNNTNFTFYNESLVLLYDFNNISSLGENDSNVKDHSLAKNDGTITNAIHTSQGKYQSAMYFNGSDQYIDIGDNIIDATTQFTFAAWVKIEDLDKDNALISKGDFNTNVPILVWRDEVTSAPCSSVYDSISLLVSTGSTDARICAPSGSLNDTSWHFIAGTFQAGSSTGLKLYIDAELINTPVSTASISSLENSADSLRIGAATPTSSSKDLNGSIDNFMIWNKTLSQEEIYTIYASNFQKINSTNWEFYINQSKNVTNQLTPQTYTYQVFTADNSSNANQTEERTVIISEASTTDITPPQISYISPTYANNTNTTNTSVPINISIFEEENINSFIYNWNNTNFTLYNESLVFKYNFNNISELGEDNTNIVDISPSQNNATVHNGTTMNLTGGIYGGAFEFDGVDDQIDLGTNPSLSGDANFSIMAWIKTNSSAGQVIINQRNPGFDGEYMLIVGCNHDCSTEDPGKLYFIIYGDSEFQYEIWSSQTLDDGNWHHVAATRNGTGGQIYIDGVLEASATGAVKNLDNSFSTYIGVNARGDSLHFNGSIDEIELWNKSLTTEQIYASYASNLKKINTTNYQFYINQSKNSTDGLSLETYTYQAFTTDNSSNTNQTEQSTVIISEVIVLDTTFPYFLDIPVNKSINYQQTFAGIQFNGTDETAVLNYIVDDTNNFTINSSGFLNNLSNLAADNYILNISVNDTSGNLNSTLWQIVINQIAPSLNLTINQSQASINISQYELIPINATVITGDTSATINLYNNFTLINSNTTTNNQISNNTNFTILGAYNITFEYLASKNFTSANVSFIVNATTPVDKVNPTISFIAPTYANNTNTTNTSIEINISVSEETNLSEFIYNWNGTNYTILNDSLVLFMNLDNISSLGENDISILDLSRYQNNGTVSGPYSTASGKHNGAFEFDADNNDKITITKTDSINSTNFTISAWINANNWRTNYWQGTIFSNDNYNGNTVFAGYVLRTGDGGKLSFTIRDDTDDDGVLNDVGDGWPEILTSAVMSTNSWHHVAASFDGDTARIYIDGVEYGSTSGVNYLNNPGDISIGNGYDDQRAFDGQIDEVRMWNQTLSQEEIYISYISNFQKINSTNWEFYINQSLNATNDLTAQTYTYQAFTSDTSSNTNQTEERTVIISENTSSPDTTLPYFLDIPSNQSINYQQTFAGIQFNGTDDTAVNNYSIEANTNFTINDTGFLNNITKLSADTYIINVTVNDTSNNTNSTLWQIVINQITPTLNLTINESQTDLVNLTQNTTIPINATIITGDTTATINLYNNFTLINSASTTTTQISNNTNFTIEGYHNITFEYLASKNFTSKNISYSVNVTLPTIIIPDTTLPYFLDIPSNQTINFNNTFAGIQFNGTDETAVLNYTIDDTNNFTINSSGFLNNLSKLTADTYILNISVNDTSGNLNSTLWQIAVNKINPSLNLTINGSQADIISLTQNTTIPINATTITGDTTATINLYNNFTLINSNTTTTNQISNNTNFTVLGYHNITFEYLESQNYSSFNRSFFVNVTLSITEPDTTTPYFSDIPTNKSINYQQTFTGIQFNGTDETAVNNYSIADTSNFTINSTGFLNNISNLAADTYIINVTVNDTSNNTNSTLWQIVINQIAPTLNLTINESQASITSLTQNTTIPINATIINGDTTATINLYNNFTLINSNTTTTSQISNNTNFTVLGYHNITFEYLASKNFTSKNISYSINVSLPTIIASDTTAPNLTINSPTNTNYSSSINFNISLSENGTAWFSLDNGITNTSMTGNGSDNAFGTEFNYTYTNQTNAVYTFSAFANDTSGNLNNNESILFEVYTTDVDNDGHLDRNDTLIGNESNVGGLSGINTLNITVGGNQTNGTFTRNQEIRIMDNNTLLVNFTHNFSASNLNLTLITINQNGSGLWVNLSGQLQDDINKTLFVSDNNFTTLCAKDAEVTSLADISTACTGDSETNLTSCLGNSTGITIGNITCTDQGTTLKIENLRFSGILGIPSSSESSEESSSSSSGSSGGGGGSSSSTKTTTDSTTSDSCKESWTCSSWSECESSSKNRDCTDQNSCGTTSDKPKESRSCESEEAKETVEETAQKEDKKAQSDKTLKKKKNWKNSAFAGMAVNLGSGIKNVGNALTQTFQTHSTKILSLGAILITSIAFVGLISKHKVEHIRVGKRKILLKNRDDEDEVREKETIKDAIHSDISLNQERKPTWMLLKEQLEELKQESEKQKEEFELEKQENLEEKRKFQQQERLRQRYEQLHEDDTVPQRNLDPKDRLDWIKSQLKGLK